MMIILSHFYGQLLPSLLCMNHSRAERTCGVECPKSLSFCVSVCGKESARVAKYLSTSSHLPPLGCWHLATLLLFI